jgi:fluoroquinolone transport system permease protein
MKDHRMRLRLLRALLITDLRKLARDPVLLVGALLPVILSVVLRAGVPPLSRVLAQHVGFDLAPHHPTILAGALVVCSMMAGWIVGFMLLEERAQQMLPVLGVTPLTRRRFVMWRLSLSIVIALLGGVLLVITSGLADDPGRALASVALLGACAPGFALMLVAFADNDVEGLAFAKFGGLVFMLPLVTLYLDGPWLWLAGVLPPFWAVQLVAGGPWWLLGLGLAVSGASLWWMLRRFTARAD